MQSLIGDRFLKRFFGRLHRHEASLAGEAMTLPEKEEKVPSAEMPAEADCWQEKDLLQKEVPLEIEKPDEINPPADPANRSDQQASIIPCS